MKNPKHDILVKDFDNQKRKHLEQLANKMLKEDAKKEKLKNINLNTNFLKLF